MVTGTESFIKRARELWGGKYDYSKTVYDKSDRNVTIICLFEGHGGFEQTPSNHLNKAKKEGCKDCAKEKRSSAFRDSAEDFIRKAKELHGEYYDYSKVDYDTQRIPVIITCPVHGDFPQEPHVHLRPNGCKVCGKKRLGDKLRKPVAQFIEEARVIHSDKYDYSKVEYDTTHTNVTIICPKHGSFPQLPTGHLNGGGCPDCDNERAAYANAEKYEALYRQRVQDIHGKKIEVVGFYTKGEASNRKRRIRAICKKHKELIDVISSGFFQSRFGGCNKCRYKYLAELQTWTTEKFIKEARKLHGDKYSYDKVDYDTSRKSVDIICPEHGVFSQPPMTHLRPSGCKDCANKENKGGLKRNTHPPDMPYGVYLIRITHPNGEHFIKVGLTIRSVKTRFAHLSTYKYEVIDFVKTYYLDAWETEDTLLSYFLLKGLKYWPKQRLAKSGRSFGETECAVDTPATVKYAKKKLAALVRLD